MTTIAVTKNDQGKLVGAGEKSAKAYERFKAMLNALEPGEMVTLDYWHPRNPELHGWHFIILTAVFESQEQFENDKMFRKWIEVGAGHCDFVPGPKGRMVAIPRSIGWDELDDDDFQEHHEKAIDFLRSPDCTRFLWGHLNDAQQSEMIEGILQNCEEERQRIRQQRGKK